MALKDVINQKKIVESMIKRQIEQGEKRISYFFECYQKRNSTLSRFSQQMLIDKCRKLEQKRLSRFTKARGLSVSLKKQSHKYPLLTDKNNVIVNNPQIGPQKDTRQRRVTKIGQALMRTAHTVGELDLSQNKNLRQKVLKCNEDITQNSGNIVLNYSPQTYNSQRSSYKSDKSQILSKKLSENKDVDSIYDIRISSPKRIKDQVASQSPHKQSNRNKLKDMKQRQFLRSSLKSKYKKFNDENGDKLASNISQNSSKKLLKNVENKYLSPLSVLSKSSQNYQEKRGNCSRLQAMISKPMIDSVVLLKGDQYLMDKNIKQQRQRSQKLIKSNQSIDSNYWNKQRQWLGQQQSSILRLKKRLQMNSINCIYERQTIVSQCEQMCSQMRESMLQVQESMIVHRSVKQDLIRVAEQEIIFAHQQQVSSDKEVEYVRYLAAQNKTNLLVTVKEMGLKKFQQFAHELRVYDEIQASISALTETTQNTILPLIKHSTQQDLHLILKAPYAQTLKSYLLAKSMKQGINKTILLNKVNQFVKTIQKTLIDLLKIGLVVNNSLMHEDLVVVFDQVKIQNLNVFTFNKNYQNTSQQKQNIINIISKFKSDILRLLN